MKKTGSQDSSTGAFANRPFAKRKKTSSSPVAAGAAKQRPVPTRVQPATAATGASGPDDDETLFMRAAGGARRIGPQTAAAQPTTPGASLSRQDDDEKRLFLSAVEKLSTTSFTSFAKPEAQERKAPGPTNRMKLLKRGAIRISEELDLHGCLRDEALRRLEQFITGAYHRGRKAVLVITGKGINSPDGPVLQGAVADWLRNTGKALVAEFEKAPRDRGGSGAVVVFLRNRS